MIRTSFLLLYRFKKKTQPIATQTTLVNHLLCLSNASLQTLPVNNNPKKNNRSSKKHLSDSSNDLERSALSSRVIVITSGKGGVGKTTVTANLGMSMARLGYKMALIDADVGLKNLDLLIGMENRITYTAMDVLEQGCRLDQALVHDKRWNNLSFLAISKNRQRYHITENNMKNIIRALIRLGYEYILIDCPAGIDVGFMNAISAATESIIVTTPELPALRDADYVLGLLESNGIFNNKILVNRVRTDMIQRYDMLSVYDAQETLGIPLLGAIPEDKEIISSTNCGEPLVLKNKVALAGLSFEMSSRKLVGQEADFLDLNAPYKSFFERVSNFINRPFISPEKR